MQHKISRSGILPPPCGLGYAFALLLVLGCSSDSSAIAPESDGVSPGDSPSDTSSGEDSVSVPAEDAGGDSDPVTGGGQAGDGPAAGSGASEDPGEDSGPSADPTTETPVGDGGAPDADLDMGDTADAGMPPEPEPVECPADALSSGMTTERIDAGGRTRQFVLQIPDGYTGETPLPLVVDLHPLFFSGSFQQGNSGYAELANREGFIVAWPDGIDGAWDIGPCCVDAEDEAFIRALVEDIQSRACVDPKRVYAAGFSMGGGMSHYLACNAADVFAAVAPAAFDLIEEMPCEPSRPISVLMFRGTGDLIVPYQGGASTPPNGYPAMIHFLGAEGSFERWAELNECSGSPVDQGDGCQTYDECAAGVEVTLCTNYNGAASHNTGDAALGWEMFERQIMP